MSRFVILTIGKTHSGKTTFAETLAQQVSNAHVIDQDNQATFIHTYYRNLLPETGPNRLKQMISQAIVDYAVEYTDDHLILSNANRSRQSREELLQYSMKMVLKVFLFTLIFPMKYYRSALFIQIVAQM